MAQLWGGQANDGNLADFTMSNDQRITCKYIARTFPYDNSDI